MRETSTPGHVGEHSCRMPNGRPYLVGGRNKEKSGSVERSPQWVVEVGGGQGDHVLPLSHPGSYPTALPTYRGARFHEGALLSGEITSMGRGMLFD